MGTLSTSWMLCYRQINSKPEVPFQIHTVPVCLDWKGISTKWKSGPSIAQVALLRCWCQALKGLGASKRRISAASRRAQASCDTRILARADRPDLRSKLKPIAVARNDEEWRLKINLYKHVWRICQHVNMNQHHQLHQNRKTSPAKWIECCDSYDSHDSYYSVWLSASKPWAPILRLGPQIAAARACTICIATRHVGDGASFYFLLESTGTAFRSF